MMRVHASLLTFLSILLLGSRAGAQEGQSALLLHAAPAAETSGCQSPVPVSDAVIRADAGPSYYVYVLAPPDKASPDGIKTITTGVWYNAVDEGAGIQVHSWTSCFGLEEESYYWPASGSGIRMTYREGQSQWCHRDELVVGGYFYLTAYSSSIMALAQTRAVLTLLQRCR